VSSFFIVTQITFFLRKMEHVHADTVS
jgi:hypothetical protein